MKKDNLYIGLVYILIGAVSSFFTIRIDSSLGSMLFSISIGGVIGGISIVLKYLYWSSPKRRDEYKKKLEEEQINLKDELKENLRNRSGRIAYNITLIIIGISIIVFGMLGALDVIDSDLLVIYLGILLVFMYVIGIVIFKKLLKEYK